MGSDARANSSSLALETFERAELFLPHAARSGLWPLTYARTVLSAQFLVPEIRGVRPRGFFFAGHHPWVALVVVVVLVALAVYLARRRDR